MHTIDECTLYRYSVQVLTILYNIQLWQTCDLVDQIQLFCAANQIHWDPANQIHRAWAHMSP